MAKSTSGEFSIRNISKTELEQIALEWAADEGWNPGINDATCFYQTDPEGFWAGFLDDKPIACISAVQYGHELGFIGFYIVAPAYRGQGYGLQIWQHAMQRFAGSSINLGLDGVPEQQDSYRKSGFQFAHTNIRQEGKSQANGASYPAIYPFRREDLPTLRDYDRKFFPADRAKFLDCWLDPEKRSIFVARQAGDIKGYIVLRPCRVGYKVGPLFADNPEWAEQLFLTAQNQIPAESKIYLDTPEVNPEALLLAEKYQMKPVFSTARMYTRFQPPLDLSGVFGITSFELG